jgi:acetoin utilization deacetylase AcuC-like enzyme
MNAPQSPLTEVSSAGSRRVGFVWHELYGWHDTGTAAGLPTPGLSVQPYRNFESADSKVRFASLIQATGYERHLVRLTPSPIEVADLLRVHTERHVESIRVQSEAGGGDGGDGWTPFGPGSFEIARLAAGGTWRAVAAVLDGDVDHAYALVRPPGHHAEHDLGRGYCLFANIAVAVRRAIAASQVRRVAIVDYDVHHGNGTQQAFEDDPNVLTISVHQQNLFPQDSGELVERGTGQGIGANLNVPLFPGSGNGVYLAVLEHVVAPALRRFRPDLIVVASGFDASALDPLGAMTVTASGFGRLAAGLRSLADELCAGRLVFSHEGGYSAEHVPYCGLAVLEALTGVPSGIDDPWEILIPYPHQEAARPDLMAPVERAAELVAEVPSPG